METPNGNPFSAPSAAIVKPVNAYRTLRAVAAYSGGAIVWGASLMGVLQLHRLEGTFATHAMCGPWGCLPPVEALISYHSFWAVLLLPPAVLLFMCLPLSVARVLMRVTFWGGLLLTLGFLGWSMGDWLMSATEARQKYALHYAATRLVSLVDVPMAQLALIGAVGALICRSRRRKEASETKGDGLGGTPPPLSVVT